MERRLTTVLAADIVGYSALMDHDRTGTIAALKAFREETFTANTGRPQWRTLIKSMGDGWIAEFQSTSEAADCAIAVQSADKARRHKASNWHSHRRGGERRRRHLR